MDSANSARSCSESRSDRPDASGMDVLLAALGSAVVIVSRTGLLVDVTVTYIHSLLTNWMLGLYVLRQ